MHEQVEIVLKVHVEGEPVTPNDVGFDDINTASEAIDVWRQATRYAQAAKLVADAAGQRLAELLGEGGAARTGDLIVRYDKPRKEVCIDPAGASAFLTRAIINGELTVADIANPQYVKKSALPRSVRDTFYDKQQQDEPRLSVVPIDRAPKFLQRLEDGEII